MVGRRKEPYRQHCFLPAACHTIVVRRWFFPPVSRSWILSRPAGGKETGLVSSDDYQRRSPSGRAIWMPTANLWTFCLWLMREFLSGTWLFRAWKKRNTGPPSAGFDLSFEWVFYRLLFSRRVNVWCVRKFGFKWPRGAKPGNRV